MGGFLAAIPMGRVGAHLYLASPMLSRYVTGQVIEVNGGQLMPRRASLHGAGR